MQVFDILRRPVITEKSTILQEEGRYTFEVAPNATKHQIKEAGEEAFNDDGLQVNTMHVRGIRIRFGPRIAQGRSWKKAIVLLSPGDTITIFEGV